MDKTISNHERIAGTWSGDGIADLISRNRWYDAGTMGDYRQLKEYVDSHEMTPAAVMYVAANIIRRTTHDFQLRVPDIEAEIRKFFGSMGDGHGCS
jgi:hypothetical protein